MDECQNDPELCTNGVCRNTQGSFECICGKGYVLAKGTTACIGRCHALKGAWLWLVCFADSLLFLLILMLFFFQASEGKMSRNAYPKPCVTYIRWLQRRPFHAYLILRNSANSFLLLVLFDACQCSWSLVNLIYLFLFRCWWMCYRSGSVW